MNNFPCNISSLPWSDPNKIDLYGHRGTSLLAPENTSVAFDLALEFGVDVLEIDVRLSRDNVVMVTHDEMVDRTTDGSGPVKSYTYDALKRLNAGYRFVNPDGRSYRSDKIRLLSLDELFEQYPTTRINIDIKDDALVAAEEVASSIDRHNSAQRVNVGSFNSAPLQHFRDLAPMVTTAATQREVAALYFSRWSPHGRTDTSPLPYQYLQIPVRYIGLPLASSAFINFAKRRSIKTVYWTLNEAQLIQTTLDAGAQGIVTDRPDIAAPLIQAKHNTT